MVGGGEGRGWRGGGRVALASVRVTMSGEQQDALLLVKEKFRCEVCILLRIKTAAISGPATKASL